MLETKPAMFRSPRVGGFDTQRRKIDKRGGRYGAGVIRGVSIITKGEALGHGVWIDDLFLDQVVEEGNLPNKGIKSRYTHPGLSGDGIGRHLGRAEDFYRDGDQVFADLHFGKTAHNTPDGNLAEYLMDLATEDPESFGLSIAFEVLDVVAPEDAIDGPDPDNTQELGHVRLAKLYAVDAVGDPAANPDGLFYRGQEIPEEADAYAAYAFGLTNSRPAGGFGVDPDRLRGFFSRFLKSRELTLTALGGDLMSDDQTTPDVGTTETPEEVVAEEVVAEEVVVEEVAVEEPEATTVEEPIAGLSDSLSREELSRFVDKFGAELGFQWCVTEGLAYEDALELYCDKLEGDLEASRLKAQAVDFAGEESPIDSTPEDAAPKAKKSFADRIAKSAVFNGR